MYEKCCGYTYKKYFKGGIKLLSHEQVVALDGSDEGSYRREMVKKRR